MNTIHCHICGKEVGKAELSDDNYKITCISCDTARKTITTMRMFEPPDSDYVTWGAWHTNFANYGKPYPFDQFGHRIMYTINQRKTS